jgi:hypothetical protein
LASFTALAREHLGPDFEFHHVWDGRVFKGFEGTMEWISDTRETWDEYSQEIAEIAELGEDDVLVVARISGPGLPPMPVTRAISRAGQCACRSRRGRGC